MSGMDEREAAIRAAAEHVARTRERLKTGQDVIERLHAAVSDTREHMAAMSGWIEQTDRILGEERARRTSDGAPGMDER
jgi:phage-related tail protein